LNEIYGEGLDDETRSGLEVPFSDKEIDDVLRTCQMINLQNLMDLIINS
jgi:hypothetical protein